MNHATGRADRPTRRGSPTDGRRCPRALLAVLALPLLGGCAAAYLVGGMAQNAEYQKQVQVLPKYTGLEDKRVAVVVDADLAVLYEHPGLVEKITAGVSGRLARDVSGIRVVRPNDVITWQWRTPHWNAMPYGDMAESLSVDRIVYVELYEYRLNPPGNRWLWEGVCAAHVNVIERDGFDPDMFVDTFNVISSFPTVKNVDRGSASATQIETGVLSQFVKKTTWLFHEHIEPKYPDKYQPQLERG